MQNSLSKKIASGAAAALIAFGALAAQSPAANAATRLGGLSVEQVCQFDYGFHAYVAYWSAYGWRCNPVPNNPYYKGLDRNADMNKACRLGYPGSPSAWANFSDVNNPYSWSCYR